MSNLVYAYARVSTKDQNLSMQLDELKKKGYDKLFTEKQSGKNIKDRPELQKMLEQLRKGDTVLIYKVDRLGRSAKDLITLGEIFKEKEIKFISIHDKIDTSTSMGSFFYNLIALFAQLERENISERTKSGLEAARKRGKKPGRKKGMTKEMQTTCKNIYDLYMCNPTQSVEALCKRFSINKSSYYRYKNEFIDNAPEHQMDVLTAR